MVNKFHFVNGGSETYHFALSEMLKHAGNDIVFFSMQDDRNFPCEQSEYFVPNVDYKGKQSLLEQIKAGLKLVYSFDARKRISKLLDKEKPDIVHVNLVHRQLSFSVIDEIHKRGIPIVYTIHDYICICPNYFMYTRGKPCELCLTTGNFIHCIKNNCVKGSKIKSVLAYLEALYLTKTKRYDKIDRYIAPSQFICDKYKKSGFSKSPVTFVRNFLSKDTVYSAKPEFNGYLLFFGRLLPEKGVLTLLKAVALVDGVQLRIAGEGELRPEMEKFIETNSIANRVKLLGYQDRKSMAEIVSKCKAVVVPSEWYENCPYSIMEAQAQGKPVIGADIGGIPELIDDGATGYIFKAGDVNDLVSAISKLTDLRDKEYNSMCFNVTEQAIKNFSFSKYQENLMSIYSKALKNEVSNR